jgi:septal ring factor EnvC (AmiA/AmiB activator)
MTTAYTRRLASTPLEVVSGARAQALMRGTLLAVLVALAVAVAARLVTSSSTAASQRSQLLQENSGLRTEVARLQAELQLERATRAGLDGQVAALNQQVGELERQLAFVQAQRSRGRTGASSN